LGLECGMRCLLLRIAIGGGRAMGGVLRTLHSNPTEAEMDAVPIWALAPPLQRQVLGALKQGRDKWKRCANIGDLFELCSMLANASALNPTTVEISSAQPVSTNVPTGRVRALHPSLSNCRTPSSSSPPSPPSPPSNHDRKMQARVHGIPHSTECGCMMNPAAAKIPRGDGLYHLPRWLPGNQWPPSQT
jgi:hypothetical protein